MEQCKPNLQRNDQLQSAHKHYRKESSRSVHSQTPTRPTDIALGDLSGIQERSCPSLAPTHDGITSFDTLEEYDAIQYYMYEIVPVAETYDADSFFWRHIFIQLYQQHKCLKDALVAFSIDFRLLRTQAETCLTPSFERPTRYFSKSLQQLAVDTIPAEIVLITTFLFWLSDLFHARWDTVLMHIASGQKIIEEVERRVAASQEVLTASQAEILNYMKAILSTCGRRAQIRKVCSQPGMREMLVKPRRPMGQKVVQIHVVIAHLLDTIDSLRACVAYLSRPKMTELASEDLKDSVAMTLRELETLVARFPSVFNRLDRDSALIQHHASVSTNIQ